MPRIRELNDRDVNIVPDPSPEFIRKVADQFSEEGFTIYAMLDGDKMFAAEETPLGFIVMYDFYALGDWSLPNEVVDVPVGGQPVAWNRRFILPHRQVIPAVREFLLHQTTPEQLEWMRDSKNHPTDDLWPE